MNGPARIEHAERPRVSVVIPTRDRPELLRRAIESVRQQTYAGEIECLVVFDRSEPILPSVGSRAGFSVQALVNDRTPGLAGARNTGVLAATGDLVGFLDDDDEWLPEKLELQVRLLASSGAALVSSGIFIRYGDQEFRRIPPRDVVTFADLLRSRCADINPCNLLIHRRTLIDSIGLVDEDIPGSYAEDYDFLLRATRAGTVAAVRRPLVRVHWHKGSYFASRWETMISALEYLLRKFPEFQDDRRGLARIYGQLAFAHASAGHRREAARWTARCLRLNPLQPRAYVAALVGARVLPGELALRLAHTYGRGI